MGRTVSGGGHSWVLRVAALEALRRQRHYLERERSYRRWCKPARLLSLMHERSVAGAGVLRRVRWCALVSIASCKAVFPAACNAPYAPHAREVRAVS